MHTIELTDDELRKGENHTLADLIVSKVPGIQSVPGAAQRRPMSTFLASSRKLCSGPALRSCASADCYVTV